MKKIIKVNEKQWAELDQVEEPPMTTREAVTWLIGAFFILNLIGFVICLAGILQGGACK